MQERIQFCAGGEIVIVLAGQDNVAEPGQRGPAGLVELLVAPCARNEQGRQHEGGQQHQQQHRQQPQRATSIEIQQQTGRGLGATRRQRLTDPEAGNDEEHVHAGEATGQPRSIDMKNNDGQHGQCAPAIDGGSVWTNEGRHTEKAIGDKGGASIAIPNPELNGRLRQR